MDTLPFDVPREFARALAGREFERVAIGVSGADVFRVGGGLFLKSARREVHGLGGEVARLRWLSGRAPVAEVVAFAQDERRDHLLTTAISGKDASVTVPSDRSVCAIASALAHLHAIPAGECPFVASAAALIDAARARLDAGVVDVGDFEEQWLGSDPEALFAELLRTKPDSEDLVITHGDACLPNIVMHDDGVSGFVDVGRAGVSHRLRDVALCARSVGSNWGQPWCNRFLEACAVDPDEPKLRFWLLLDEFF